MEIRAQLQGVSSFFLPCNQGRTLVIRLGSKHPLHQNYHGASFLASDFFFNVGSGGLDSGPRACRVSPSLAEPSPSPRISFETKQNPQTTSTLGACGVTNGAGVTQLGILGGSYYHPTRVQLAGGDVDAETGPCFRGQDLVIEHVLVIRERACQGYFLISVDLSDHLASSSTPTSNYSRRSRLRNKEGLSHAGRARAAFKPSHIVSILFLYRAREGSTLRKHPAQFLHYL